MSGSGSGCSAKGQGFSNGGTNGPKHRVIRVGSYDIYILGEGTLLEGGLEQGDSITHACHFLLFVKLFQSKSGASPHVLLKTPNIQQMLTKEHPEEVAVATRGGGGCILDVTLPLPHAWCVPAPGGTCVLKCPPKQGQIDGCI